MYCEKCGHQVSNNAFYCQWCGVELDFQDIDWITEKIKALRQKSREVEAAKVESAKYIAHIWESGAYKSKHESLDAFAKEYLDMDKSLVFKYKDIGLKFFDKEGHALLPNLEQWGVGKLIKLLGFSIDDILLMQNCGLIDPEMPATQLDAALKQFK